MMNTISPFNHLANEILLNIISKISQRKLSNLRMVCKLWDNLINEFSLCRPSHYLLYQEFQNDVRLIKATIHDFHLYLKISQLFSDIYFHTANQTAFNSFIYGPYTFTIENAIDIHISDHKSVEMVLEGNKNKKILQITIDEPFLFALQNDGAVAQWDFINKKFVRYHTPTTNEHHYPFKNLESLPKGFRPHMVAKQGVLVLQSTPGKFIDIILYRKHPSIYRVEINAPGYLKKCEIGKSKIYLVYSRDLIQVWNIAKRRLENPIEFPRHLNILQNHFKDASLDNDYLLVLKDFSQSTNYYKIHLTKQEIQELKLFDISACFDSMMTFEDLLIGFDSSQQEVTFYNIKTQISRKICLYKENPRSPQFKNRLLSIAKIVLNQSPRQLFNCPIL